MTKCDFDLGILDSGAAGLTLASGAAHLGVRIMLVEKEPNLGTDSDLLVALGRAVNIEGLNLERISVDCDRHGIKVDRRLRTSQKHIFAAGDVIGGYQSTHAAGCEGGIVVSNAVFHLARKTDYTWMPW